MPGLSLWLLPPEEDGIDAKLHSFITSTSPKLLGSEITPHKPHVTLTSLIPRDVVKPDAQAWLDTLDLDPFSKEDEIQVQFSEVAKGPMFFKRIFIRLHRTPALLRLAAECRRKGVMESKASWLGRDEHVDVGLIQGMVKDWVHRDYDPHVSLAYTDVQITDGMHTAFEEELAKADIGMQPASGEKGEDGKVTGWKGGRVVLMSTDLDLGQWDVIAQRTL